MQKTISRIGSIASILILIIVAFFCQLSPVGGESVVRTDRDIYYQDEMIRVYFSNSPGNDRDWICIVPAGSPDTDGGDYQYMPRGVGQGLLIFNRLLPGQYEVRAYYDYSRNGYVVTGRHAFSVVIRPNVGPVMPQRMEGK
jgi:hypothetical protein